MGIIKKKKYKIKEANLKKLRIYLNKIDNGKQYRLGSRNTK